MPSSQPGRTHFRPVANLNELQIPITRQPQRFWFRIHKQDTPAILFSKLPHHRFSHPDCPFPVLYVGATIPTCLWEYFGDDIFRSRRVIPLGKWNGCCLSRILVPELKVCALNLEKTRDAMSVDRASLLATDLTVPQDWALAIQRHPAEFDAIRYSSRFLDQTCLALFDRRGMHARLHETLVGPLDKIDAAVNWLDQRKTALI